jgi:hypothetical protein
MKTVACCRVSVHELDVFKLWSIFYGAHVDQIVVVIVLEAGEDPSELEKFCNQKGIRYKIFKVGGFHPGESMRELEKLTSQVRADWIIHADSDEFMYEINDLPRILETMNENGDDYAIAWMADRLAFGGYLKPLNEVSSTDDLEKAFPVRAAVTEKLAKGCPYKVCISRWPHHGAIHHPQPPLQRKYPQRLTLEHFKWRDGLVERLKKRIRDHQKSGLPWGIESKRILHELNSHGRIRAERYLAPRSNRIHGWMDYENIYLDALEAAPGEGHFVEVGVWQGKSLCFLAEAALAKGKNIRIDGVDPFRNYPKSKTGYPKHLRKLVTSNSWIDLTASNLRSQGMLDYVNLIQAKSLEAANLYKPDSLDFVWLDGAHDYNSVIADINAWWPKIRIGGRLGGHDYKQPQVKRAVSDLSSMLGTTRDLGNSFVAVK